MFGLTQNNPANDPDKKPIKSHSKFLPNYSLYQGALYGEYTPHFAMEVVPDDSVSVRCNSDVDTMNLKAPLMFPVKMYHDYFLVPLRAILPRCADLLVTNPLTGEDVVPENVNCGIDPKSILTFLRANDNNSDTGLLPICGNALNFSSSTDWYQNFLATFFTRKCLYDLFCSRASLLNVLGFNVADYFANDIIDPDTGKVVEYDQLIDRVLDIIRDDVVSFDFTWVLIDPNNPGQTMSSQAFTVLVGESKVTDGNAVNLIGFRTFLRLLGEGNVLGRISNVVLKSGVTRTSLLWGDVIPGSATPTVGFSIPLRTPSNVVSYANHRFINLQRLVAYQLACVQFYTNDGIDYVYNAELYHQNQISLAEFVRGSSLYSTNYLHYQLNGITMRYDSCSAYFLNKFIESVSGTLYQPCSTIIGGRCFQAPEGFVYPFLHNIFGHQRTLKYRDYFVGSKARPLAVGSVDVNVNTGNNTVNVIDVTRNIMRQRFLNQVNRLGRSIKEYSRGIFGVTPMPDPHEPILLASTCDIIGASETDSTEPRANMSMENTTTSKLRNSSNRFALELNSVENGILIGITHFDAVRPYTDSTDRQFFHVDRFDMFNPFMQNVGDQEVSIDELNNIPISRNYKKSFGYQLRYAEYKQRVDRAVGPFAAGYLPGYAFPIPKYDYLEPGTNGVLQINPDFIRSRCEDFDQFYSILSYFSKAGYFHFIIRNDLEVTANRPMESAPTIL